MSRLPTINVKSAVRARRSGLEKSRHSGEREWFGLRALRRLRDDLASLADEIVATFLGGPTPQHVQRGAEMVLPVPSAPALQLT